LPNQHFSVSAKVEIISSLVEIIVAMAYLIFPEGIYMGEF